MVIRKARCQFRRSHFNAAYDTLALRNYTLELPHENIVLRSSWTRFLQSVGRSQV